MATSNQITSSSTAEYFAKNLQQVGFSSATKAVLTTLKEAVDNSLDACEVAKLLPDITVEIQKVGTGSQKNTDLVLIVVEDNGPGIDPDNLAKVFGEYLASSKFGRGQCSRGQQGIGISAATTWAQLTNALGVQVTTKTDRMRKAVRAVIDVDIKKNQGIVRQKETVDWDKPHGLRVEFRLDGRIQLNGDGGLLTYLEGTTLVNPHLKLRYKLMENDWVDVERVTQEVPEVPPPTNPHPHTMKLGEFITHAHLFGKVNFDKWLKTGFSRVTDSTLELLKKNGLPKTLLSKPVGKITEEEFKTAFKVIQDTELIAPSTKSVLMVGEESLSKSIRRLGEVDFFSVVTRKPRICDFKPVCVEVALARFKSRGVEDQPLQVLRFANRVPLQFDKAACAITHAIESVNWRTYGLNQPKDSVPLGPYVFAVSVVSPFIKFKNASKETIDGGDELVEEIRRALIQAGQKLSRFIRREEKEADLLNKIRHIEQFGPMLVEGLVRITKSSEKRKLNAEKGLAQILGKDAMAAEEDLDTAKQRLHELKSKEAHLTGDVDADAMGEEAIASAQSSDGDDEVSEDSIRAGKDTKGTQKVAAKDAKKKAPSGKVKTGTKKVPAGTNKKAKR